MDGSDNLEQIEAFAGVDDTAMAAKYPAFYFAKNYKDQTGSRVAGTAYETGWYLPSVAELFQICACCASTTNGFNLDVASRLCGGASFAILTTGHRPSSFPAIMKRTDSISPMVAGIFSVRLTMITFVPSVSFNAALGIRRVCEAKSERWHMPERRTER